MNKSAPVIRKGEKVQAVLDEFSARTPEALIAMVTTSDGLSVASTRKAAIAKEEDALAVASARILEMAADVNNQLNQGRIGRILIEGSERTTVVVEAGRDTVLIVVVPADAKLGLVMLSISKMAEMIADIYH
jgi:predicted regulator of Ras-like GTPase activity (Roadblock/LC7/MglB family)